MLKRIIARLAGKLGYEIRRKTLPPPYYRNEQMLQGFIRSSKIGINPATIVDVGAAAGTWSLLALEVWPQSSYVLFEPLEERSQELTLLSKSKNNFFFVPKAAGREASFIDFHVAEDLDGSGVCEGGSAKSRKVEVTSIYDEVKSRKLSGPYLVKLDTHGFEVPILEGCQQIKNEIELFIIECYGFEIANGSLKFWEMCNYMQKMGFRLFDIVDIMHRSKDGAFWQCDAFFIRDSHPIFSDNKYA